MSYLGSFDPSALRALSREWDQLHKEKWAEACGGVAQAPRLRVRPRLGVGASALICDHHPVGRDWRTPCCLPLKIETPADFEQWAQRLKLIPNIKHLRSGRYHFGGVPYLKSLMEQAVDEVAERMYEGPSGFPPDLGPIEVTGKTTEDDPPFVLALYTPIMEGSGRLEASYPEGWIDKFAWLIASDLSDEQVMSEAQPFLSHLSNLDAHHTRALFSLAKNEGRHKLASLLFASQWHEPERKE